MNTDLTIKSDNTCYTRSCCLRTPTAAAPNDNGDDGDDDDIHQSHH